MKPCQLWTGARNSEGYGYAKRKGRFIVIHRAAYEALMGPIPIGMEIDHLCRVRHCIEIEHMEVVTHRTNTLRGFSPPAMNARKTHCPAGHPYDDINTRWCRGYRYCRECKRISNKSRRRGKASTRAGIRT